MSCGEGDGGHEHEHEIREEGSMESGGGGPAINTLGKRKRSSLSRDGDEGGTTPNYGQDEDQATASQELSPSPPQLGSLHKRRASASPQKFNRGHFEPLPLRPSEGKGGAPVKKARRSTSLEITYDSTGTPQIAGFSKAVHNQDGNADVKALGSVPTPTSATSTSDTPTSARSVSASFLLDESPSPPGEGRKKGFSLLHAICRDNDLLLLFVSYLSIPQLISLYAISKPFHYLFNRHHTAFILSCMRTWAPNADRIYPWRCYRTLCAKDPSKLQKLRLAGREDEVKKKWDGLRDVPSLRWLQMVVWREGVCRDMLIQLATRGLRCPPGTLDSIKVQHPPSHTLSPPSLTLRSECGSSSTSP